MPMHLLKEAQHFRREYNFIKGIRKKTCGIVRLRQNQMDLITA